MIQLLIVAAYLFGFLAALTGLLFGASFTRGQRERFPILRKLDGKKVSLAVAAIVLLGLSAASNLWKDLVTIQPSFQTTLGPTGQPTQKATLSGFEQELEQGATELKQRAEDFFNAAERNFEKQRYADAADNYQKSSSVIPTRSAYLNLGLSLWYVSDFARAKANALTNIGIVYRNQGKLQEALKSHREALAIHKEIGNPLGQATALTNIGNIYANRGKLEEALKSYQEARVLFLNIGAAGDLRIVTQNMERLETVMK